MDINAKQIKLVEKIAGLGCSGVRDVLAKAAKGLEVEQLKGLGAVDCANVISELKLIMDIQDSSNKT